MNSKVQVTGQVKWFDPAKGFGFVVSDALGPDILLHANVLRNYGQSSIAEGVRLELAVQSTPRGVQAVEILRILPAEGPEQARLTDLDEIDPAAIGDVPLQAARVKWFDRTRGFGFANLFGDNRDIFIHVEVLRRSGLSELMPGEAVALRVIDGKRGLMACEVCPWELAARDSAPQE